MPHAHRGSAALTPRCTAHARPHHYPRPRTHAGPGAPARGRIHRVHLKFIAFNAQFCTFCAPWLLASVLSQSIRLRPSARPRPRPRRVGREPEPDRQSRVSRVVCLSARAPTPQSRVVSILSPRRDRCCIQGPAPLTARPVRVFAPGAVMSRILLRVPCCRPYRKSKESHRCAMQRAI